MEFLLFYLYPLDIIFSMPGFMWTSLRRLRSLHPWKCLLIVSILAGILSACSSAGPTANSPDVFSDWKLANLRLLQAPGSDLEHSLIAIYTRTTIFDLEIRLDFLDLTGLQDIDVYIALDTQPGGSADLPIAAQSGLDFDILVKIPAVGLPQAFDARLQPLADLLPRSANHPGLDLMTIQLNRTNLPGNPSEVGIQAFVTLAEKSDLINQTSPVSPTVYQPVQAPLLLVFWDTLPAATPAQILRRWDGAHTGPYGGRHGLSVLLQAAASQKIPLVLADIRQPSSLTALSAVGGLNTVRNSLQRGDLIIPESAVGDPVLSPLSLAASRQSASANHLPGSSIAFGSIPSPLPDQYSSYFAELEGQNHIISWQSKRLIPLPGRVFSTTPSENDPQVGYEGLTLNARQVLLRAALSPDPNDLAVFGGSLPNSAWGEFSIAPSAFEYIAAHPWIKPLSETALSELPAVNALDWPLPENCRDLLCSPERLELVPVTESGIPVRSGLTAEAIRSELRERLEKLKSEPLAQIALLSYLSLSQPTESGSLAGLQANALGYVGYLLEAIQWNESPVTKTDCSLDLDFDGNSECILASSSWLVILKTGGGRLVFAAHRGADSIDQWIGSPAQFGVGLGDSSEWKPEIGPKGNPAEIPGAFEPENAPYEVYTPEIQPGKIILSTADHAIKKTFILSEDELSIDLSFPEPYSILLPLTLAPQAWANGSPIDTWLPVPEAGPDRWAWKPASSPGMSILFQDAQNISVNSSLDSIQWLSVQENPNHTYPPGHYLPFPSAFIRAQGSHLSIIISPR